MTCTSVMIYNRDLFISDHSSRMQSAATILYRVIITPLKANLNLNVQTYLHIGKDMFVVAIAIKPI